MLRVLEIAWLNKKNNASEDFFMKENIIFKASKNKLTVVFNDGKENFNFNEVRNDFCDRLEKSEKLFCNKDKIDFDIEFKGHNFSSDQKEKLISIFYDKMKMDVNLPKKNSEVKKNGKTIDNSDLKSIVYKNSLRSGQFLHYDGNVILIGDINSGAEIIATGNIFVMGKVKGMLHAGANGNKNCIITALNIFATQIRIAGVISCVPEDKIINQASRVYIDDDRLCISPLLN